MKSAVFILIDAFGSNFIGETPYRNSPTPYIDSLMKEAVSVRDMYSMAPFTEAALIATWGGENTLDHGSAMKSMEQCREVIAEMLSKSGYKTISTIMPYIYPSAYKRGVDEGIYNYFCRLHYTIELRLKEYKSKYDNGTMQKWEYDLCREMLKDTMDEMIDIDNKIFSNESATLYIAKDIDEARLKRNHILLLEERKKLQREKEKYIRGIFEHWNSAPLFEIEDLSVANIPDADMLEYLEKEYGDFLDEVDNQNFQYAKKNNRLSPRYLLSEAESEGNILNKLRTIKRLTGAYYNLHRRHHTARESIGKETYAYHKNTVSINTQFEHFRERIKEYDEKDKPFYAYIHADDFHFPSIFFTYDTADRRLIQEEFECLKRYIAELPSNYCGNLITDLSAVYIDFHLKRFITEMKKELKHDVVYIITADHGYSYYQVPPRAFMVNNFHQENFSVPFIVHAESLQGKRYEGLYSSSDIKKFVRKYVLEEKTEILPEKYVRNEWIPGCPDISTKQIYYAVFDGRYKLAVKCRSNEAVSKNKIVSFYDLEQDPLEKHNLKKKYCSIDKEEILLSLISNRHIAITGRGSNGKTGK